MNANERLNASIASLNLANRMINGMLEVAMGQPKSIVAEAAVRCAIAIVKGCVLDDKEAEALEIAVGLVWEAVVLAGRALAADPPDARAEAIAARNDARRMEVV